MSAIAEKVYKLLKKIFPHNVIVEEHYVRFKGVKLFFDFFIKDLNVLVEVQGQQHSKFIRHFHGNRDGFVAHKKRDNLKVEFSQKENIAFVRIYYDENVTKKLVMNKIYKAIEESDNE